MEVATITEGACTALVGYDAAVVLPFDSVAEAERWLTWEQYRYVARDNRGVRLAGTNQLVPVQVWVRSETVPANRSSSGGEKQI